MNDYIEFGGGIGDAFNTLYTTDRYTRLSKLGPGDRVKIVVMAPTRHVTELFMWHPNASQLDVKYFVQWPHTEDGARRLLHGLPPNSPPFKDRTDPVVFYPSPRDNSVLDALPLRFLVLAASAGGQDRNLPDRVVLAAAAACASHGIPLVAVGKTNATRNGRPVQIGKLPGLINTIDRLTLPGAAAVVSASSGVICCHSSICILAWHLRKPTFLVYPAATAELVKDPRLTRGYFFGLGAQGNLHAEFSAFSARQLEAWVADRRAAA